MNERIERRFAAALIAFSFLLFSCYSIATPLFEASDELWHYPVIEQLVRGGGLPVQTGSQNDDEAPWRQEGSQPPLYYAIAALASAPFDHGNWRELRRLNVHANMGVPMPDGNSNAVLHTPAEAFPWTRAALAIRIARLVSILMSTVTVLFVYLAARELFGLDAQRAALRLGTIVFAACVPMFAFISGAINNDNAAVMFSTIGFWLALRIARAPVLTMKHALWAGAIAGLGALSKSSALGLLGLFALAAFMATLRQFQVPPNQDKQQVSNSPRTGSWLKAQSSKLIVWLLALTTTCLIICGWWFARNQQLYGDLLGWNGFLDSVGRRAPPATLAQLWSEREGFVWSYWGVFGTLNVIMPPPIYTALNAMAAIAVTGCALALLRNPRALFASGPALAIIWTVVIFVALVRWTTLTPASQGRLMFPAIAALACGMAYGLWRLHPLLMAGGAMLLATISVSVPFATITPVYRTGYVWSGPPVSARLATFGNELALVRATVSTQARCEPAPQRGFQANLDWRLMAQASANYSVFVHAVDAQDVIVAQRDMHPGQGNLATAELAADTGWTDRYHLRVDALQPPRRDVRVRVGVYDAATGTRLRTETGAEWIEVARGSEIPALDCGVDLLRYDAGMKLGAIHVPDISVSPASRLPVTMTWITSSAIARDFNLSLQLIDDSARKVAQRDIGVPTRTWKPGESNQLVLDLDVARDAPPGVYKLLLVWYVPEGSFPKIGAYGPDGQYVGDQVELTKIRVR